MVILKSYFIKGSRIYITCSCLSKIELSTAKVYRFQYKAIATKSSILDIAGVPYPPLIRIFG